MPTTTSTKENVLNGENSCHSATSSSEVRQNGRQSPEPNAKPLANGPTKNNNSAVINNHKTIRMPQHQTNGNVLA